MTSMILWFARAKPNTTTWIMANVMNPFENNITISCETQRNLKTTKGYLQYFKQEVEMEKCGFGTWIYTSQQ